MSKVVFFNEGLMDKRAITTFGLSAKVNSNPIGFFGTGLKYAIAILIRNEIKFSIRIGKEEMLFDRASVNMRGKDFDLITMNGQELPFGTNLGINWELWQAFRELYCNALDEGGSVIVSDDEQVFAKNYTQVIVDDERFVEIFKNRDSIVLPKDKEPIYKNNLIEVYKGPSKSGYYRGVRVLDFDKPTMFTYNILETTELTEDRIVKQQGLYTNQIPNQLRSMKDKDLIKKILTAPEAFKEFDFQYHIFDMYYSYASDEFKEVMEQLYNDNDERFNRSALEVYMDRTSKNNPRNIKPYKANDIELKMMEKALGIVEKVYPDVRNYEVIIAEDLGKQTMALANSEMNAMIFSRRCFTHGTKYLVSTMIEEFIHLDTGYNDCTRSMQTYLFDQIATLIEKYVIQEPI